MGSNGWQCCTFNTATVERPVWFRIAASHYGCSLLDHAIKALIINVCCQRNQISTSCAIGYFEHYGNRPPYTTLFDDKEIESITALDCSLCCCTA